VSGASGLTDPLSNVSNRDGGVRVSFSKAGRVRQVRYRRLSSSNGTLTIRAWDDATTSKITEIADIRSTAAVFTVTFPIDVLVTASGTWTFTVGAASGVPATGINAVATNTADMTFVAIRESTTNNLYPSNTVTGSTTYYVEPIFEPQLP
jgi:hypothetical protein